MNEEEKLRAKLLAIEATFAGAVTAGEPDAPRSAQHRIAARLRELGDNDGVEAEVEIKNLNAWSQPLFVALAQRYGIRPYRYKRQRLTTRMIDPRVRAVPQRDVLPGVP
jgi:hypothetical protein